MVKLAEHTLLPTKTNLLIILYSLFLSAFGGNAMIYFDNQFLFGNTFIFCLFVCLGNNKGGITRAIREERRKEGKSKGKTKDNV